MGVIDLLWFICVYLHNFGDFAQFVLLTNWRLSLFRFRFLLEAFENF